MDAIAETVRDARISIAGTGGPLRCEPIDGGSRLRYAPGEVTPTARLRNGLQCLDFALAALAAAEWITASW